MRPARLRKICDITKKCDITPEGPWRHLGGVYLPETARFKGGLSPTRPGSVWSIWPPLSTSGVYLQETGGSRRVYLASLVNRRGLSAGDRRA